MKKLILLVISTVLFLTSCSTILHKSTQNITIKSASNQNIIVFDKYGNEIATGKGTLSLSLKRGGAYSFTAGGARENEYTIKTSLEEKHLKPNLTVAYVLGNSFTFGIGYLVDNITGAKYVLEYNDIPAETIQLK